MSFNIKAYLIDIDREIVEHRQEIAKRRLRISELEDTRVLMMQREEYRAELAGEPSPFGTLPNGAQIVTRQMSDQGVLSHAAKTGALPSLTHRQEYERSQERKAAKKAYQERYRAEHRAEKLERIGIKKVRSSPKHRGGSHSRYKKAVTDMLRGGAVLNMDAIIERLGEGPKTGKARQPVYQALYELKRDGIVNNANGPGTYHMSPKPAEPAESTPTP